MNSATCARMTLPSLSMVSHCKPSPATDIGKQVDPTLASWMFAGSQWLPQRPVEVRCCISWSVCKCPRVCANVPSDLTLQEHMLSSCQWRCFLAFPEAFQMQVGVALPIFSLFFFLSLYLSIYLSIYLFIYLSIYLSISLSISLYIYIYKYISLYFSLLLFPDSPSIYIYIYIYVNIAVVLLSGPSVAFWGVIIWAKFVCYKTMFVENVIK